MSIDPRYLELARLRLAPQPTPTEPAVPLGFNPSTTDHLLQAYPNLHPEVAALFVERREHGRKKYPMELCAFNGRNFRYDLLQELVDAAVYSIGDDIENGLHLQGGSATTLRILELIEILCLKLRLRGE